MNLTLLTAGSPEFYPLLALTAPNKLAYCLKYHYQLVVRRHFHQPGERQQFILDSLSSCDWLWFMGADTLITNFNIKASQFCNEEVDLVIGRDANGINNDSFFIKNSAYEWIQKVKDLGHDQESMASLLPEIKHKVVSQKLFNAYPYQEYYKEYSFSEGQWYPGDFVIHLPGMIVEKRITLMKEYLQQVI